jgi:DNA-binding NtrC family response regulator
MVTSTPQPERRRSLQVVGPHKSADEAAKPSVFLFDANQQLLKYLSRTLNTLFDLRCFDSSPEFLRRLTGDSKVDLLVYAWDSEEQSLRSLQDLRKLHPHTPILSLCCSVEPEDFALLSGLCNGILMKPFTSRELSSEILQLLAHEPAGTKETVQKSVLDNSHYFVRASKAMHEVERQASLVASSDIPVLILGESGTGKEILAIYLHTKSRRHDRTFLKINCAAMPAELLESELFGYEAGAFTGAVKPKQGKFEVCDGGTIFLDEIGEMPAPLQAKLLQVLQDGTFSRLGSRTTIKTNVRVLSATNIAMKQSIQNGSFREDLYYRLNGLSIKLPPLRERMEELPAMIDHFIQKGSQRFSLEPLAISPRLEHALKRYHWPGNLRELENLINRLLVLRDEATVLYELEHEEPLPAGPPALVHAVPSESSTILQALEDHRWNRRAAAEALQISYKTLLTRIRDYNLVKRQA